MNESSLPHFEELARKLYHFSIEDYARGSDEMEEIAIDACRPTIAAITLAEEYAALILTSRMDTHLAEMLRSLCRFGDADKLLFDSFKPLGSFSAKINASYAFGLITLTMFKALDYAREIRNCYAHTDDPTKARTDPKYLRAQRRLLTIDKKHTAECVSRMRESYDHSVDVGVPGRPPTDVIAVMHDICNTLRHIAIIYRVHAKTNEPHFSFGCFGWADMETESRKVQMEQISKTPDSN
ncbi:hypothetical protein [Planctellipticum variicoloris]|uniref:hypothetical protein n=1 Tax=Planctellipticum variicoloris TaxID=3064265 RepID=UPI00301326D2|nr:hypothetical protein SH412_001528 [Planctomycetaceae bacterium SH412]